MWKLSEWQYILRKLAYTYLLTPAGVAEKAGITLRFLQRKLAEYDRLREEIDSLRRELEAGENERDGVRPPRLDA